MKKFFLLSLIFALCIVMVSCSEGADSSGEVSQSEEEDTPKTEIGGGLATFAGLDTLDTDGNSVSVDIFAEKDITLVNVWATWCPPCIEEMPYLAEIYKEMGDSVGIVGVVTDVTQTGAIDENVLSQARDIMTQSGVEFPVIYPDQSLIDAKLNDVQAIPTTFFVDSEGNIVGETYTGAREKEDWIEIINAELEAIGK